MGFKITSFASFFLTSTLAAATTAPSSLQSVSPPPTGTIATATPVPQNLNWVSPPPGFPLNYTNSAVIVGAGNFTGNDEYIQTCMNWRQDDVG
ncbi:hypothetical protein MMC10_011377, partial [Thelotrema lepadinum]|nr:hypothetical protein [Thelotrema lepadinum]